MEHNLAAYGVRGLEDLICQISRMGPICFKYQIPRLSLVMIRHLGSKNMLMQLDIMILTRIAAPKETIQTEQPLFESFLGRRQVLPAVSLSSSNSKETFEVCMPGF